MKKLCFILLTLLLLQRLAEAQCPPNALALTTTYPQCPGGCGVLLKGWPEGVIVNIYGGSPITIISSVLIPGTYGGSATGDAFTCVPCGIPLIFASAVPGATNGCVVLYLGVVPVKISHFSVASVGNSRSLINWSASNELSNTKYLIERSTDGRNFVSIGTVNYNANTGASNNYSFTDINVTTGSIYYRLKTIEITGNTSVSETILVKNGIRPGISIQPNPTVSNFTINIPNKILPAEIIIVNSLGQKVYTERTSKNLLEINKKIGKGIYYIRVVGNDNNSTTQTLIIN